ncbi:copper transpport protein [Rhodotorula sphaerocarpa]
MDHGGHMDHGGMDHGGAGAMACKITAGTVVPYLTAIILLAVAAEYLRLSLSTFDRNLRSNLRGGGSAALSAATPSLNVNAALSRPGTPVPPRRPSGFGATDDGGEALLGAGGTRAGRYWGFVSFGYTSLVALGYYLHLLVMSYNAQIIAAVLFGIFLGHFIFHRHIDLSGGEGPDEGKGLQCH